MALSIDTRMMNQKLMLPGRIICHLKWRKLVTINPAIAVWKGKFVTNWNI